LGGGWKPRWSITRDMHINWRKTCSQKKRAEKGRVERGGRNWCIGRGGDADSKCQKGNPQDNAGKGLHHRKG